MAGSAVGGLTSSLIGAASSYLLSGGNNILNGNDFNYNWKKAVASGAIGGGIAGGKEALKQGKNVWWGNDVKHNRTQWSVAWWNKPDVINFSDVTNTGNAELNCMAKSFQNMYGGTEVEWQTYTNDGDVFTYYKPYKRRWWFGYEISSRS